MGILTYVIFFAVSFFASIAGAICGIGGGVIIKPVLDAFGVLNVAEISFLSSCTVLIMSCYSVLKLKISRESQIDMKSGTFLAVGAAVGGILGNSLFNWVKGLFSNANTVGAVQAACLLVITVGTLIYTVKKDKIHTKAVKNIFTCLIIGLFLGLLSSFLGIGGGPINLVVLFYFFSMQTKTAAQNSLYIIFFSQAANLLSAIASGTTPVFSPVILTGMAICGLLGAIAGRSINKLITDDQVNKLFISLMAVIILINVYNIFHYTA